MQEKRAYREIISCVCYVVLINVIEDIFRKIKNRNVFVKIKASSIKDEALTLSSGEYEI